MAADYWLVKKQHFDIPALYNPHGRYRYRYGCNWRAAIAFLVPVGPLLPGLALSISGAKKVHIDAGETHLYTFNWLFGFVVAIFLYTGLSWAFPARDTLLTDTVWNLEAIEGRSSGDEEKAGPQRAASPGRKGAEEVVESDAKPL